MDDYKGSEKPHIKKIAAGAKMKSTDRWLQNHKGELGSGTIESAFYALLRGSCGDRAFSSIGKNGH